MSNKENNQVEYFNVSMMMIRKTTICVEYIFISLSDRGSITDKMID